MKQKLIAVVLATIACLPASAFAQEQGRLTDAAARAASHAAAQAQPPSTETHQRNRYFWPGLAMIGGGATLAALSATAAKKDTCGVVSIGFDVIGGCVSETNKALLWTGVAAAGGGATLLAIGGRHHQIAAGPTSVRYSVKF